MIDIGGSKTHGILISNGEPRAEATVGSANVQNVTPAVAAANIAELFRGLAADDVSRVVAGAGGVDTEADRQALEQLIRPHAPHAAITVVHDSELILAAAGERHGIAVIAGTGSAAWGRNHHGHEARSGGWGYLLGDEGSGYWLGREAVRHSLLRMNEGQRPDLLTELLIESCGLSHPAELIARFHSPETGRRYWACQARAVTEAADQGHPESDGLLKRTGQELAALALVVARQLNIAGPVVLGGGLGMNVPRIQRAFCETLAEAGINEVRILDQPPVHGARHLLQLG
jgi:N-acetylglucosamine kinase-like BadF-type ATPase